MKEQRPLLERATEYFSWRRKLGFKAETERDHVLNFAKHVDTQRIRRIDLDVIVNWARASRSGSGLAIARRYEDARRFLVKVAHELPGVEIPPSGYLGRECRRGRVHIYSDADISELHEAAGKLIPVHGLRPHTIRCLLGLLEATGIRIGEAVNLDSKDVDLEQGTLNIREAKGGARLLPIHRTCVDALKEYAERRVRRHPSPRSTAFFLTEYRGTGLQYATVDLTFQALKRSLGWQMKPAPRIHDFRHTFAVRTLLDWIRGGKDVDSELPALSAYLGHARPSSTYWYFSAVPELNHLLTGSLEHMENLRAESPVV
jgi:integrase